MGEEQNSEAAPAGAGTAVPTGAVRRPAVVFAAGTAVGVLGGMIGLGGAEFRLPLLIGLFGFAALSAVIVNKAMSLVVVLTALPARLAEVSFNELGVHWAVAVNLLAGSLIGAYAGAAWAVRMRTATLYKVLAALMVLMAAALVATHAVGVGTLELPGPARTVTGVVAGFGIGVVAAIMGVAGGELLIPTIVLLYGIDIKTAGSLSLLVSLPTMLVAFARYSRDSSFTVLRTNLRFAAIMTAGSITGALLGGLLLGMIPDLVLIPALALILLISAAKLARHAASHSTDRTTCSPTARVRCWLSPLPLNDRPSWIRPLPEVRFPWGSEEEKMEFSRPFDRTAVMAACVMTAVAAITVTLPGTAEAQSGSRICGNYWEARAGGKTVGIMAKLMEAPKIDFGICLRIIDKTNSINGRSLPGYSGQVTWNPRQAMRSWTCEEAGHLFNGKYGADPCLSMNRVDLLGQVAGRTPTEWSQVY